MVLWTYHYLLSLTQFHSFMFFFTSFIWEYICLVFHFLCFTIGQYLKHEHCYIFLFLLVKQLVHQKVQQQPWWYMRRGDSEVFHFKFCFCFFRSTMNRPTFKLNVFSAGVVKYENEGHINIEKGVINHLFSPCDGYVNQPKMASLCSCS